MRSLHLLVIPFFPDNWRRDHCISSDRILLGLLLAILLPKQDSLEPFQSGREYTSEAQDVSEDPCSGAGGGRKWAWGASKGSKRCDTELKMWPVMSTGTSQHSSVLNSLNLLNEMAVLSAKSLPADIICHFTITQNSTAMQTQANTTWASPKCSSSPSMPRKFQGGFSELSQLPENQDCPSPPDRHSLSDAVSPPSVQIL